MECSTMDSIRIPYCVSQSLIADLMVLSRSRCLVVEVEYYGCLFIILYGKSEILVQTNYHKPRGYIADLNDT